MSVRYFDWIAHHARRQGKAVAAVDLPTGRALSYREFSRRIDRLAGFLAGRGVRPGDRVAVLAHGSTDVFALQFACFRVGAIFVPLNWRLAASELAAILADCTPLVLMHDASFGASAELLRERGGAGQCCLLGAAADADVQASAGDPRAAHPATLDDVATILYTSGTTGAPKGVTVTHGMNFWNAVNSAGVAGLSCDTVFLCVLPLFHTAGLNVFANPTFHLGGRVVVAPGFDAAETLRAIGDPACGITHFFAVPAHFQFMAQHESFDCCDFTRLRLACVGAAPTPEPLIRTWERKGVTLQQGYGMSETGPLMLFLDRQDAPAKPGSAGKPPLHAEIRVVDAAGADAGPGEVGEIWVRGPSITPGYWNRPEVTRSAFTDGWLHTGDAARVDADGFYFVVDRWKDMYISGGENVYPAEVENVLYRLPAIAEAAVIGVPDATWGEVGCAVLVLRQDATLGTEEVLAHCAAHLARFKLPRSVMFTEALPRTATGKVHKPTLRQQFGG